MSLQDIEARRSTAVQFFMEDDSNDQKSSYNKIVEWLNQASVAVENKTDYLRRVQEIIIHKEESLLDNFLDEVLGFQNDRNTDVRKFIVGFIEEACKKDPDMLPRVVANLSMLLQDSSVQVQKRVIQAASQVYRCTLGWLAKARSVTEEMEATWSMIGSIKAQIVNLVDSDNDGIRTQSVKFLECIVLMQTYPEKDSMRRENDFSLEDVPLTLKIARRRKLEEEAHMVFDLLLQFHGSQHISSVNLMTCMGTITLIAKMRPQFMGKVIAALETLHTNLPPTLSKSQVSSVRKHLKMQLLNLLKLPSSVDYHNNITTLLTDLGATYQEVMKSYPKMEEVRRRQKRMSTTQHQVILGKKPRLDVELEEDEDEDEEEEEPIVEERPPGVHHTDMAIDVTEQYIVERLSPEMATQLVLVSMAKLPDTMPPHFSAMYTPIAAAGTHGQIKHVARLMATQWTASGLGPGAKQAKKLQGTIKPPLVAVEEEDDEIVAPSGKNSISTVISGMMDKEQEIMTNKVTAATLLPSGGSLKAVKQRIKTLKLSEITKPLDDDIKKEMLESAIKRILKSEKDALMGGVGPVRNKIITTLAATYNQKVREVVLNFLLEDLRSRIDLGFAWLYEEYSFMQGFNRMPAFLKHDHPSPDYNYNKLLCTLASNLIEKTDAKDRDLLLTRLYLEAPLITEEATDLLRNMCADESRAPVGLHLLMDLVIRRPPRQLIFLNALLVHTAHENSEVRSRAIQCVVELYDRGDLRCIIEEYAILYLSFLRLPQPPDVLFGADRGRPMKVEMWNEDIIKVCLYLYLALLPINEKLIHELARVYVQTVADVKRTILRLLEQPVRGMGMDSPQLLTLVEECPKGAETLVTRVIHILTDKTPPSAELVARVRDLYHTRVSDVRFLIPVLNGLTKKEVIAALPKLIKLNPVVVKEVFNRLLGTHAESMNHTSPLTPAELLIALHTIDPSKCELKTVIKATSMCFAEKQAYTQEVLAVVMQHLMELNPLPTLLMRTVIQSLSFYPRLIGFVMNILQRLILKQVWKQKKVWEGFIKCCQRTKPQSFQVLLQLPPAQLSDVFENSPDLRQPLLSHVMAFTENQRAHIPQSIMDVLLGNQRPLPEEYDVDMDQHSPVELTIDIKEEPEVEPAPPGMD